MITYLKPSTLKNKTVLVRVDFNVPVDGGTVGDTFRIESALETIKMLQEGGNRIILVSHLGRPEGKRDEAFSLRPVAHALASMLGYKFSETDHMLPEYPVHHLIFHTGDLLHERNLKAIREVPSKDIVLLENIRFYKEEEAADPAFAKRLAGMADAYVNDSFGVDHRSGASITGVPGFLPSYAGPLLEKEIKSLDMVLHKGGHPFVLMMGGIKISDKVATIENLGRKADKILLGGGLANLFFASRGLEVGKSRIEMNAAKTAWELDKTFKGKIVLPPDVVVANEAMDKESIRVTTPYDVHKDEMILDCGPKTMLEFANELKGAKTIVWNGPLGRFEVHPFHHATMALARIVGGVATRKAFAVVGGGETVDAVRLSHQASHIDHLSTGGGAMLEYLAGKKLPGIEALE